MFGTETGTPDADSGPIDPDLAYLVDRWPELPEAVRADILALAKAGQ